MTPEALTDFLNREIPFSKTLELKVTRADYEGVEVMAPLSPSRNHLDTAFGGSLGAVLILACYTWLFHRLRSLGFDCHVVIKQGETHYDQPVAEEIRAVCHQPDGDAYEKFLNQFKKKGLARIQLSASVQTSKGVACRFEGEFVAQKEKALSLL